MSPKPILKRTPSTPSTRAVHFPPSPALTATFVAHSPAAYDRSPIVVGPNVCALPERGCPGRTYQLADDTRSFHPRMFARRLPHDLPALVPDLSSESEESDGFSVPLEHSPEPTSFGIHGLAAQRQRRFMGESIKEELALSFLPWSPKTTPPRSPISFAEDSDDGLGVRRCASPRRRSSRERSSRVRGTVVSPSSPTPNPSSASTLIPPPISTDPLACALVALSISPPASPTKRSLGSSRKKYLAAAAVAAASAHCTFTTSFGISDDGCLGGF